MSCHDPFGEQEEMRREIDELIRSGKIITMPTMILVARENGEGMEFVLESEWNRRQEIKVLEELEKAIHKEYSRWEKMCQFLKNMITRFRLG